ncbi:MAG TPA: hypothetical protein VE870_06950 [Bacteroidales bacterium]|nr:hypothetical protein [Bacteroidales bacterium]
MKKILLLLIILLPTGLVFSQKVELSKNVDEQYKDNHGPNMRHYGYFYTGLGIIPEFDKESGSAVKFWGSGEYTIGYRYKLKLLSFYALGFDASFIHTRYNYIIDDLAVTNPDNPLTFVNDEKRHALVNNSITLEVYQRINLGKRGNTLGNYLDVGLSGSWNHTVKEVIVKEYADNAYYAGKSRTVNRKLDFPEPFSYGVKARIGHNKFVIYGNYRLSDYFRNDTYDIPELPRLRVGVELGF